MKEQFESDVIEGISELKNEMKTHGRELGKINDALYGNGHPGLISRMTVMENNFRWAQWIAGTLGGIVGFAGSLLTKIFIKGDM